MLPLGTLFIVLASPLVRVIYERGAFSGEASQLVASLLVAYGLGMFVYLARDVLVRVFYALGDGQTPFRISLVNIGLNALLDFWLIRWLGAPGLVLATVGVNIVATLAMVMILNRRLGGLPLVKWGGAIAALTALSGLAGLVSWGVLQQLERHFRSQGLGVLLVQLLLPGAIGLLLFILVALILPIPEVKQLAGRLRQRLH
jgi:putative peptidoglycan lipid II flippase